MANLIKSVKMFDRKEYEITYIARLLCNADPEAVHKMKIVAENVCNCPPVSVDSKEDQIIQTAAKMNRLYYEDVEFIRGMVTKLAAKRDDRELL